MSSFRVIILGSDDNAYGTSRLLHERYGDPKPLMLCTRQLRATAYSRLFELRVIEDLDTDEGFVRGLRAVLEEQKPLYEKLLVVPCSDYYLYLLSRHYAAFDGMIANRVISEELLTKLDTKDSFYKLCEQYGLRYPKTLVASPAERLTVLDGDPLSFPIVVKPENSNATDYLNCKFEGKLKVFYFENKEDYLRMVANMNASDYKGKLILQEYIPGDDSAMRTLNCYVGSDGKVKCAVLGHVVLEEYAPKTLGNYAAIVTEQNAGISEKLSRFLEAIGYIGFANFDMKVDPRTGKEYLFEINPRLGRSSFFVHGTGVNMMELLIEDYVNGSTAPAAYDFKEALWTAVPKSVLLRYTANDEMKETVRRLWKKGSVERTLFYAPDLRGNPRRRLTMLRHFYSYVKTYRTYFFRKKLQ